MTQYYDKMIGLKVSINNIEITDGCKPSHIIHCLEEKTKMLACVWHYYGKVVQRFTASVRLKNGCYEMLVTKRHGHYSNITVLRKLNMA